MAKQIIRRACSSALSRASSTMCRVRSAASCNASCSASFNNSARASVSLKCESFWSWSLRNLASQTSSLRLLSELQRLLVGGEAGLAQNGFGLPLSVFQEQFLFCGVCGVEPSLSPKENPVTQYNARQEKRSSLPN